MVYIYNWENPLNGVQQKLHSGGTAPQSLSSRLKPCKSNSKPTQTNPTSNSHLHRFCMHTLPTIFVSQATSAARNCISTLAKTRCVALDWVMPRNSFDWEWKEDSLSLFSSFLKMSAVSNEGASQPLSACLSSNKLNIQQMRFMLACKNDLVATTGPFGPPASGGGGKEQAP